MQEQHIKGPFNYASPQHRSLRGRHGVRTWNPDDFIKDLEGTFDNLRKFRWKINLTKCIFGVPTGKLLCFIISNQGIKANPEKVSAITQMGPLVNIKDV